MAFSLRNLSVLSYANGFTLWHYNAKGDSHGTVQREKFFEDAKGMLSRGDVVLVSGCKNGKIIWVSPDFA